MFMNFSLTFTEWHISNHFKSVSFSWNPSTAKRYLCEMKRKERK